MQEDLSEPGTCFITGLPILNYSRTPYGEGKHSINYSIKYNDNTHVFSFDEDCLQETLKVINENRDRVASIVLNGQMKLVYTHEENRLNIVPVLCAQHFEKLLKEALYPTHPQELLDNLFISLSKKAPTQGSYTSLDLIIDKCFALVHYFKNEEEAKFYINVLEKKGLVELKTFHDITAYTLTYEGLLHSIDLTEEGQHSRKCFVAMSFDEAYRSIFLDAIVPACINFNYEARRTDFLHPDSDNTINDFIIAEIKKCKFCIADFTKLRAGVYFEAGYALGRGKKVIYTCHRDYFGQIHFDVNHYPVLIYESVEELQEMLINKIEAFIEN